MAFLNAYVLTPSPPQALSYKQTSFDEKKKSLLHFTKEGGLKRVGIDVTKDCSGAFNQNATKWS